MSEHSKTICTFICECGQGLKVTIPTYTLCQCGILWGCYKNQYNNVSLHNYGTEIKLSKIIREKYNSGIHEFIEYNPEKGFHPDSLSIKFNSEPLDHTAKITELEQKIENLEKLILKLTLTGTVIHSKTTNVYSSISKAT